MTITNNGTLSGAGGSAGGGAGGDAFEANAACTFINNGTIRGGGGGGGAGGSGGNGGTGGQGRYNYTNYGSWSSDQYASYPPQATHVAYDLSANRWYIPGSITVIIPSMKAVRATTGILAAISTKSEASSLKSSSAVAGITTTKYDAVR